MRTNSTINSNNIFNLETSTTAMVRRLADLIGRARLDLSDEKRTQADIATLLRGQGIEFAPEEPLSKGDIIDFMAGCIGIEVKLKGSRKKDVYKQLCRFPAESERVTALILATNLTMGLPETINEKPVYMVRLGQAWL